MWITRYRNSHKCINSKAALLILIWTFAIGLYSPYFPPNNYNNTFFVQYYYGIYGLNSFFLCFYPLAGCLADNKFGRYKSVLTSLEFVFVMSSALVIITFVSNFDTSSVCYKCWILALTSILLVAGSIVFKANVIQFGMDQLHDSPGDHQNLFIYWYVWTNYTSKIFFPLENKLSETFYNNHFYNVSVANTRFAILLTMVVLLLFLTLLIAFCNKQWFLIDSAKSSPYKLVYRVTKFAYQHKVPIRRSAFTYCEDDIPSGLDLGKHKYGGPFTTEQVENVKAFYGILKILFTLGFSFFLEIPCNILLYNRYIPHLYKYNKNNSYQHLLFYTNIPSSLLVILGIPVYVFVFRPFCMHLRPSMLKAIGFGILLRLLSATCIFILDTIAHSDNNDLACMFNRSYYKAIQNNNFYYKVLLFLPHMLYSLSYLFIYISLYQLLCAQSPHSMKGLLIGLSFAVEGLFNFIASVLIIPFMYIRQSFPSCCMDYYLMNIVIGAVGIVLYVCVARKYKLRERDEPCHIRRFVEEYYSKI